MAQANAGIGVARAAYFPSVTLSASGGFESFSAANWLSWSSRFWSLGASGSESLFDGGSRSAAVRQAKAVRDEAAASYRQTVLSAFQQVEDELRVREDFLGGRGAARGRGGRCRAEKS